MYSTWSCCVLCRTDMQITEQESEMQNQESILHLDRPTYVVLVYRARKRWPREQKEWRMSVSI